MKLKTHPSLGAIPEHWDVAEIGDVADVTKLAGYEFTKHINYIEEGQIIALRSLNVVDGQLDISKIKRIARSVSDALPRSKLFENDLLLTYTGSKLGDTALIDENDKYHLAPNVCRLRAHEGNDAYFLYLFLRSKVFANLLDNYKVGSGQPTVPMKNVRKIPLPWPPVDERKKIGNIYSSLNDKIELNRQTNQTLENIAQAIFKSWFVDFEPTRAKIAAKKHWQALNQTIECSSPTCYAEQFDKPKQNNTSLEDAMTTAAMCAISGKTEQQLKKLSQETQQQLKTTAALFPDALVESELGEIPAGWGVKTFGDVSQCFDSKRIPLSKKKREEKKPGNIPYYGATSIMDYVNEWVFDDIYLLLGEDGSVIKENGAPFVQYIWGKAWVNNHAHVLQGKNGVSTEQLMLFIQGQNIAAYITGAVQLKLNQGNMNSIPFIDAGEDLNAVFHNLISPSYEKIRVTIEENLGLTKLRDTLLPKLLSGELTTTPLQKPNHV